MTNKRFTHVAQAQREVDYIIKMSNVLETVSSDGRIHEETHLNVDVVLAEPISVSKKREQRVEKDLMAIKNTLKNIQRHNFTQKEEEMTALVKPSMPQRERLIVHEHIDKKARPQFKRNFSSLFGVYS
jgi:hypothetical protein